MLGLCKPATARDGWNLFIDRLDEVKNITSPPYHSPIENVIELPNVGVEVKSLSTEIYPGHVDAHRYFRDSPVDFNPKWAKYQNGTTISYAK